MARDFPEWAGERIEYVEPTQAVRSCGYDVFVGEYGPATFEWNNRTIDCVAQGDGPVATERAPFPDADVAAAAVKASAAELGAAMCGVTALDQRQVFAGHDVPHASAIVLASVMDFEEIRHGASERHMIEVLKVYALAGKMACDLAAWIRSLGYAARAHTLRFEQVNMLPLAVAAGLGELGKHGSIINRRLGCSFRVSTVTTDLPLAHDAPIDEGIDAVCANCQMCTRWCPGDAIGPQKQMIRGQMRWLVDTEKCAPYWGSYMACGICLQACPFNAQAHDGLWKRAFVESVKGTDLPAWRAQLQAGLQRPWEHVVKPDSRGPGWRNAVRGRGPAGALQHGLPVEGLPPQVYEVRRAMGIEPPAPESSG